MGDIIKFPRKRKHHKKIQDFFVERLPRHQQYDSQGSTKFTCATCEHTTSISFTGMIFKNCSFYCGNCGVGYTMNNPIFLGKDAKKNK